MKNTKVDYEAMNFKQVQNLLKKFTTLISQLTYPKNNIVIGGSVALFLHGIEMGDRMIDDLDIIIYNPIGNQKRQLELLQAVSVPTHKYTKERKVLKMRVDLLTLNFISEKEDIPKDVFMKYEGFLVQSVKNVINAKKGYKFKPAKSEHFYIRDKDIKDLNHFKNINFNI